MAMEMVGLMMRIVVDGEGDDKHCGVEPFSQEGST